MKISVKKRKPQQYSITIGDSVHTLGLSDLKTLVLETVKAIAPGALSTPSITIKINSLAASLESANEPNLQEFILHAQESELLMLLKSTEENINLHKKMFDNMSARKHTILSEDLQYKFQDGIADEKLNTAISTLSDLADKHHL